MAQRERETDLPVPVALGPRRVASQLSTFLPQLHLTLISVLQGVALAVLIGRIADESPFAFPAATLYVDALVLLALVWHQYSWVFVSYVWPLSFWHQLLNFAVAAAESYAFLSIGDPDRFLYGLAAVSALGAVIRFVNVDIAGPRNYEPGYRFVYDGVPKRERGGALLFAGTAITFFLLGVLCALVESPAVSTVAGLLVLLVLLGVGTHTHAQLDDNLDELLRRSRWRFDQYQIIDRELEKEAAASVPERGETRAP